MTTAQQWVVLFIAFAAASAQSRAWRYAQTDLNDGGTFWAIMASLLFGSASLWCGYRAYVAYREEG